jgi:hypothetical protein
VLAAKTSGGFGRSGAADVSTGDNDHSANTPLQQ